MREDRNNMQLRKIVIKKNWNRWAEGSMWVEWGQNIIAVTASIQKRVPKFLLNKKSGWVTVEYRMLPRATSERKIRNENQIVIDARQVEISRFLGRVIRNTINVEAFPGKTIWIDCDVVQADGGTRVASLLGGFLALTESLKYMKKQNLFTELPLLKKIAGISVARVNNQFLIDPDFEEDSLSSLDLNVILDDQMNIVELQGGAEGKSYSKDDLITILNIVQEPIKTLFDIENQIINE